MVEADQTVKYACGKCRKVLFQADEVVDHMSAKAKNHNARRDCQIALQPCTSIFLEIADWMNLPEDGITQQGKIVCPKPGCEKILGSFAHYGAQCSCGRWMCPSYQITESKVDKIVPITFS